MTTRQQYAMLAGVLAGEAFVLVLTSAVAVRLPVAGGISFLVGAAVVFYYGSQRPLLQGVVSSLFNALLLSYFSQSHCLPVALLFLLICGVSPYVKQLSAHLSRFVFTTSYVATVLALVAFSGEGAYAGSETLLIYALVATVAGFTITWHLIRHPSLEQVNG